MITSTVSKELKTCVAANLASCIGKDDKKVCLIDLDIRNPKYLTNSGISIQSSVNLGDINLVNVNIGDLTTPAQLYGFNIFNTLYS